MSEDNQQVINPEQPKVVAPKKELIDIKSLMPLIIGIALIAMKSLHWLLPYVGVIFILGWGYLTYEQIKNKKKEETQSSN